MAPKEPVFPLIAVGEDRGLDLLHAAMFPKASYFSILKQRPDECTCYDALGNKWSYEFVGAGFKNTALGRFLAHTFYNPSFPVTFNWTLKGTYAEDELKQKIKVCIDADDDVITQFVDGKSIELSVMRANGFKEIVAVLNKLVFNVDTDALWNKPDMTLTAHHVVDMLQSVRKWIVDDSDTVWTHFANAAEMREEIDRLIAQLENNEIEALELVHHLFAPTGSFQEHAISNGWTKEYGKMAKEFDEIYDAFKQ